MRVTVNGKTLSDGAAPLSPVTSWWLEDNGLDGWYSPPAPRAESPPIPDGDGGLWPSRFLVASRVLAIRGLHASSTSSLARAEAEEWLGSLDGVVSVAVEDEHGLREVTGFQSAAPNVTQIDREAVAFSLFVTCPDPVKYGLPLTFRSGFVENAGRTPVLPTRIIANGTTTSLRVSLGGRIIRWQGAPAGGVQIDCRTGTVTEANGSDLTTGLVEDDVPYLAPGRTPLTITTDASWAAVEVRPGWR